MTERVGKKQFEMTVTCMKEALSRVPESKDPVQALLVVYHQCDAMKAAAIAYAGELESERFRREQREKE